MFPRIVELCNRLAECGEDLLMAEDDPSLAVGTVTTTG